MMAVVTANTKTRFEFPPAFPVLHRIRDFGLAAVNDVIGIVVLVADVVVVFVIILGAAVVLAVAVVVDGRFFMIDSNLNHFI